MGKGLAAQYAVARSVFEEADDTLGFRLSAMCFEGPEDALKLTENTQPAQLVVRAVVPVGAAIADEAGRAPIGDDAVGAATSDSAADEGAGGGGPAASDN